MAVTPVVLALSASGEPVARRVAEALSAPLHGREGRVGKADVFFANALDHARDLFAAGVPIVGVCASGILIRAVAPLLADKRVEPPVVSVADDGSVVVPLLGGHRGANRLARDVAAALGGVAAVTTAGDVALGIALDEPPDGWVLGTPDLAQDAMARLLGGARARVDGDEAVKAGWLEDVPVARPGYGGDVVAVDVTTMPPVPDVLTFHPQRFALGVGCSRDCPVDVVGHAEVPVVPIPERPDHLRYQVAKPRECFPSGLLGRLSCPDDAVNRIGSGYPKLLADCAGLRVKLHLIDSRKGPCFVPCFPERPDVVRLDHEGLSGLRCRCSHESSYDVVKQYVERFPTHRFPPVA